MGVAAMIDATRLIDAILMLVGLEFIAFVVVKKFRPLGPPLNRIAVTLASGAFLLCATRAALAGETSLMLGALAAAGLTHCIDMTLRWL